MRALRILSWAFPLAFGAALLSLDLARPWTGSYDANGALFSTIGRNYLRYGLVATRGGQVVNGGQLARRDFRVYTHHPPGLPLTMAASFALFGVREWSARLVPILFTLGAAALLCLIARQLAGPWAGGFAALVFVAQPMVAFYGRMPDHEAPGAFFTLALVALYLAWRRAGATPKGLALATGAPLAAPASSSSSTPRGTLLIALCAVSFLGVWYAWVVFVVPWLLLAHHALTKLPSPLSTSGEGRRERAGAAGPWRAAGMRVPALAASLGVLAVLGHIALVEGGLGELWAALRHRLGSQAADSRAAGRFGLDAFLLRQYGYFVTGFSLAALGPCLAWVAGIGRRRRADTLLVAALLLFALFNVAGFRQGAYVHIYYQFYLALPLALAAGLALDGLRALSARYRGLTALALVVAALIAYEGWHSLQPIRQAVIPEYADQMARAADLHAGTEPSDHILVLWERRPSFRQLTYYADRNLTVVPNGPEARRLLEEGEFTVLATVRPSGLQIDRLHR